MADGEGKLPSLADTIAAVRRELSLAQAAGQGQPVQFWTGPVELEFEVAVTRTGGGQAGVQLWVLTLGGKGRAGACEYAADQDHAAAGEARNQRGRAGLRCAARGERAGRAQGKAPGHRAVGAQESREVGSLGKRPPHGTPEAEDRKRCGSFLRPESAGEPADAS